MRLNKWFSYQSKVPIDVTYTIERADNGFYDEFQQGLIEEGVVIPCRIGLEAIDKYGMHHAVVSLPVLLDTTDPERDIWLTISYYDMETSVLKLVSESESEQILIGV